MESQFHALRRTNQKGVPFVGVCTQCGQKELTISDAFRECPNIRGLTQEASLLEAINGGES